MSRADITSVTESEEARVSYPERLLTVEEARDCLRISQASVYRLLKRGDLLSLKVGSRTLIDPRDLRTFIESRRRVCGEDASP